MNEFNMITEGVLLEEILASGNKNTFWRKRVETILGDKCEDIYYASGIAEDEFMATLSDTEFKNYVLSTSHSTILTEDQTEDYENFV